MLAVRSMSVLGGLRRLPQTLMGVRSAGAAHREHTHAHAHARAHAADEPMVRMENPFKEPQKGCLLCDVTVDFKNIQLLSQFISPHTGRIYGRHITGLCGHKQKEVSKAIKKAHAMGFMSVTHKHPQFMKDLNISSIKRRD